jgi:hypothetical protein
MAMLQPQYAPGTVGGPQSYQAQVGPSSQQTATQVGLSSTVGAAQNTAQSTTYIPDYAESPILREAAQYARSMAPQVYQWGMDQYNKNQGNIDAMMRNALTYASPARIKAEMGMAQAGVQQGAEAGRQSAIRDLQGYGIDPSAGRYAALDNASRVMSSAQAAGAGNVQRMATEASGLQQQQAAQAMSNQNVQTGYGAAGAMTGLLNTAMSLKFPPLGTTSSSQGTSSNVGTSSNIGASQQTSGGGESTNFGYPAPNYAGQNQQTLLNWGQTHPAVVQQPHVAGGGDIPDAWSPTGGKKVDDVPANLTAGEFVIPKDVAEWKGQEFFYKLMAASRKTRAMAGSNGQTGYGNGSDNGAEPPNGNGYQFGGRIPPPPSQPNIGYGGM